IFQGRQTIRDDMNHFFTQEFQKQHIYLLYGLGGAGKTQIGLKFISDSSCFTDKFFLDASSTVTIETSLKNIATMKNVGSSSQDALKWLANTPQDWLLFYDNADDPKINLHRFLPWCDHGNIIITSRNPELRVYAGAHSTVSDMDQADAVALLLKSAAQPILPANEKIATEIVKELWYLPLAIAQAGAFISQSGALDSYLDIYTKNRAQLLSQKSAQSHDDYVWTVYTTWQMSVDQLSQPAAMFLQLCSFLHRDGISEDIFSRAATYKFRQAIPSREAMQKPLEFLAHFDWEKKTFSMHPLVHSWSRTTISDQKSYHSIMADIMGMSIAEIPTVHQEIASLRLISHIESLQHGNQQMVVNFGTEYGMVYYYAEQYEVAKEVLLAVLERQKQVLSVDHPDTLHTMGNLASIYCNLQECHKAEELHVVVLEKRKQILGDDHPDTLQTMRNLARTCHKLQKYCEAEELGVVVLETQKKILGVDHPDTLGTMGNLASTYRHLQAFHKAEQLEVGVLEKQKQVLGDDHPDTLRTMSNLASTYHKLQAFHKAEELGAVVLSKRKQILGDNHLDTLRAMSNLASTYHSLDKLAEAEELEALAHHYEEALHGCKPKTCSDKSCSFPSWLSRFVL
ncbi:P-loop containing nucleoside triphosphate hydrolase protein, partial [Mycena leptocephala]